MFCLLSLNQCLLQFEGSALISTRFYKVCQLTKIIPDYKKLQVKKDQYISNCNTTQKALLGDRGHHAMEISVEWTLLFDVCLRRGLYE